MTMPIRYRLYYLGFIRFLCRLLRGRDQAYAPRAVKPPVTLLSKARLSPVPERDCALNDPRLSPLLSFGRTAAILR